MKKILFSLLLFPLLGACTSSSDDAAGYLAFLYRYMPLPDSVDYSREFWKRNVETSLRARREMPWGPAIPEREWRHFVLPVRVNNENLDDARTIIYNELKDRVKLMPMRDAILWVNHWCLSHRSVWRGEYLHRCSAASCGHPRTPGLYASLGAYRRQPRMGRGMG